MNIEIMVPSCITIPDDMILELADRARRRFDLPENAPVHATDLVMEAMISGVVGEAEYVGWELCRHEDVEYTDEELREISKHA